jgi:hypothetical protein
VGLVKCEPLDIGDTVGTFHSVGPFADGNGSDTTLSRGLVKRDGIDKSQERKSSENESRGEVHLAKALREE